VFLGSDVSVSAASTVGVFVYVSGEGFSTIKEDSAKHPERIPADNKIKTIKKWAGCVLCIPKIIN
jgi:hypothetical protein